MSRKSNLDMVRYPRGGVGNEAHGETQAACRGGPCLERWPVLHCDDPSEPTRGGGFPMPRLIADRPVLRMTSELGRVMAAARAREQSGATVLHLERGEPDFDTPAHIVEALAVAARAGETHYPDARGERPLRAALVEKLGRGKR